MLLLGLTEVLSHRYAERKEALVAAAEDSTAQQKNDAEKANSQAIRDLKSQLKRAQSDAGKARDDLAKVQSQSAQNAQQIAESRNLKNRIRELFASIDPNILRATDGGETNPIVRMQPSDIKALGLLADEQGSNNLMQIEGFGNRSVDSMFMNGTLGPQVPVPDQTQVMMTIFPA